MEPFVSRLSSKITIRLTRCCHSTPTKSHLTKDRNRPLSGNDMPRPGGIATFMRLPYQRSAEGLDVCFVGIPLDCGTSNRSGTRFGPRQIRTESSLLRPVNAATGDSPFDHLNVADVGDIPITMYDLKQAVSDIRRYSTDIIVGKNCKQISMGGDHTVTYPILQAIHERYGPVGLVHVDAHSDTNDTMMGCEIAHGTPFRRAVEDGLLITEKVIQIGIRGTSYTAEDFEWCISKGFSVVKAEECWHKSLTPLMDEVRVKMGSRPIYVSLDIDALDPAYAPGTGTPEIGGLSTIQMLEIIRGLKGTNIVGGDLVEVSPPYDTSGNTALIAANLLFELLCILPK